MGVYSVCPRARPPYSICVLALSLVTYKPYGRFTALLLLRRVALTVVLLVIIDRVKGIEVACRVEGRWRWCLQNAATWPPSMAPERAA